MHRLSLLALGLPETEIRQGLLPKPPNLSLSRVDAAQAFWVIKHWIKASAMPAWGKTHSDELVWNMVAFMQRLPDMSPEQYRAASGDSEAGHTHDHSEGDDRKEAQPHHEHESI